MQRHGVGSMVYDSPLWRDNTNICGFLRLQFFEVGKRTWPPDQGLCPGPHWGLYPPYTPDTGSPSACMLAMPSMHSRKKTVQNCFCNNVVKFPPTMIIFGTQIAQMISLCEVHLFSTSPNWGRWKRGTGKRGTLKVWKAISAVTYSR